ncbi:MAG TPA: hypothetical protein PLP30_07785 [Clostridia bacterium]|mgnify:CR=1 FL=1|nr:hypothetical protein [Clostridia bacterium]HPQ47251.1 hypothetical protein [Clostridia bacterium]
MSYCVECGVELADYHEKCPLCSTAVNNPNRPLDFSKNDYPIFKKHHAITNRRRVVRRLVGFILSMSFMMMALIPMLIDLMVESRLSWSLYPLFACLLLWTSIAIPFFKKRNTFFGDFSLAWIGTAVFIVIIDLLSSTGFTWSRFVISSMLLVWVLMAGIFIPEKIRKFVPVLLAYIVASVGYFLLIASWIAERSAILSLVLPLEGVVVLVFLVSFFLVRSKMHGVLNFILLLLADALAISLLFDLIISHYVMGRSMLTWSLIVTLALVPMIITAIIIKKRLRVRGLISKKLHR